MSTFVRSFLCPLLLATALLGITGAIGAPPAHAQRGDAAEVVGTVLDEDGAPLAGATVVLTNESTGFTTGTTTNADGDYLLTQLPLGGPYTLTASFVGFADRVRRNIMLSQGDRVQVSFTMQVEATEIDELVVEGSGFRARDRRLGSATSVSEAEVQALPAADRTFTNLQQLSPVIGSGGNIFGQAGRNNSITIDGVNAREAAFGGAGDSPYKLSMEALREFEIVTNSYDVTEGRGAQGAIRAVTKSGTNAFEGSFFSYHWDERLAAREDLQGRSVTGETKWQRGFTLGGPIIENKLHFFVAYDGERFSEQYDMWAQSTDRSYYQSNFGSRISADDMQRLLDASAQYGVNGDRQQIGFFQRDVSLDTYFVRLDWQLHRNHRLSVRTIIDEYQQPNRNNSDIGRHGIFDATYDFTNEGNNTLVNLRSQFGSNTLNELKLGYFFNDRGNRITTARHPQLWVVAESTVDGASEPFVFVPRYNRWTPETQISRTYSLKNNTYTNWNGLDLVVGTDNRLTVSRGIYTHDTQGRFDFYSIEAFENMEPDRYRRKHARPGQALIDPVEARLYEFAVYAQATREIIPHMEATLGLRYDLAFFGSPPDYNPTLEEELGYRNDVTPVDFTNIQPRLNVYWDVNGRGRDVLSAGAGLFMGNAVTRPYIYSLIDNGIRFTQVDVQRGDTYPDGTPVAIPTPDYDAYAEDYDNIPGEGLTDEDLGRSSGAQVIRFLDEDLKMPRAFRTHLSYHRYLTDWLRVGVSGYYSHVTRMHAMENVNLPEETQFTVNGEDGREVYVAPEEVGEQAVARKSDAFAQALMFTNGYEARTTALVLDAEVQLPDGGKAVASYTRNVARGAERFRNEDDQRFVGQSYFDDYETINEGYSPNDFRHKVLLNVTSPEVRGWRLGTFLNLVQRGRFSALIDQFDVSGTGIRERYGYTAFIFDPDDPQTRALQGDQFVEDLRYVFDNAHPNAVEYLRDNIGQYATPNGGINPWRAELNLRLSNTFTLLDRHRLVLNVDVFNVLNLIDEGWGGYHNVFETRALYAVERFDPETRTFQYRVNREWGQERYEGSGFTMAFGLKYLF